MVSLRYQIGLSARLRAFAIVLKREASLQRDLVMRNPAALDMAPRLDHLKPMYVAQSLVRLGQRGLNRILNTGR